MNINIQVKPKKVVAKSKNELIEKISKNHVLTFMNHGDSILRKLPQDDVIRVYNLQKIDSKYNRVYHKSGQNKGKYKESIKIVDSHWVAFVYDFNINLLKLAKIKLVQKNRNFVMVGIK